MLLSSAKFELSQADEAPLEIDVTQRVGLDLIMPVAAWLPLERRLLWSERSEIPRRVLDTLADGSEDLAAVLAGPMGIRLAKLLTMLPKVGPASGLAAVQVLIAIVRMAGPQLKELNAKARENHDYLTATLTQFKLDLEQGVKDRLLLRSLK